MLGGLQNIGIVSALMHVPPSSLLSPRAASNPLSRCALWPVAAAVVVLACASCSKPAEPPPTPTPEPTATPVPTPVPTPTPKPTPTPVPTPPPVAHRYAPAGVYYLTSDATVRLKAGLKGVVAGTAVKMVAEGTDVMQVTDGEDQFMVKKSQLTNDLDIAATVQKRAAADASEGASFQQAQEAALLKQQQEQTEFLSTHPLGGPSVSPSPGH